MLTTTLVTDAQRRTIARILRVNHAGEYGAIRIYGAQIALARNGVAHRAFLTETIAHERVHCRRFRELMPSRGTRPCGALPLWGLGGSVLGALTAILGTNAVMICTEAVERTVHRHLNGQLVWLGAMDLELSEVIAAIQVEELGHLRHAIDAQNPKGKGARVLDALVAGATELLIWLSTYGASARMAHTLNSS